MLETAPKRLILLGAGGHGREVCGYLSDLKIPVIVFDETKSSVPWFSGQFLSGFDQLRTFLTAHRNETISYLTAFGDNRIRKIVVEKIQSLNLANFRPYSVVHDRSYIGAHSAIGAGTLLAPMSLVTAGTEIGNHCILNVKASISHDCRVGDYCNINPGAQVAGNVTVGEGSYIGAGATVIEKIRIGKWVTVGAGAVVTRDLPDGVTAVGVPARILETKMKKVG